MRASGRWVPLILLAPFVALLWLPFYNRVEPSVGGFPFFYVWLFGWTVVAALLTWVVWAMRRGRRP